MFLFCFYFRSPAVSLKKLAVLQPVSGCTQNIIILTEYYLESSTVLIYKTTNFAGQAEAADRGKSKPF